MTNAVPEGAQTTAVFYKLVVEKRRRLTGCVQDRDTPIYLGSVQSS